MQTAKEATENAVEFVKNIVKGAARATGTWRFRSEGSPNGSIVLAPKGVQPYMAVANRKNRRFAEKIKRGLMTEARAAERRKREMQNG